MANNEEWEEVVLQANMEIYSNNSNDKNPYHCQLSGVNIEDLHSDYLKEAIFGLLAPTAFRERDWVTKKALLKSKLLLKRIKYRRIQGIVVHTGKTHIDRDDMVNWVNLVFKREMGATIEQIMVLSRYSLVIFRSFDEQQRILEASPLYMDG